MTVITVEIPPHAYFSPRLPPLDPDYQIVEHNRTRLHEYAAGLLQHLHAIRQGEPANGYGKGKIKVAADWLLGQYAEAKVSAPVEAVALWCEVLHIKPTPNARTGPRVHERLRNAYRAAYLFDGARDVLPRLYAVAKHVREQVKLKNWSQEAAEAAIRNWRKDRHYRNQVRFNRDRRWLDQVRPNRRGKKTLAQYS